MIRDVAWYETMQMRNDASLQSYQISIHQIWQYHHYTLNSGVLLIWQCTSDPSSTSEKGRLTKLLPTKCGVKTVLSRDFENRGFTKWSINWLVINYIVMTETGHALVFNCSNHVISWYSLVCRGISSRFQTVLFKYNVILKPKETQVLPSRSYYS